MALVSVDFAQNENVAVAPNVNGIIFQYVEPLHDKHFPFFPSTNVAVPPQAVTVAVSRPQLSILPFNGSQSFNEIIFYFLLSYL